MVKQCEMVKSAKQRHGPPTIYKLGAWEVRLLSCETETLIVLAVWLIV